MICCTHIVVASRHALAIQSYSMICGGWFHIGCIDRLPKEGLISTQVEWHIQAVGHLQHASHVLHHLRHLLRMPSGNGHCGIFGHFIITAAAAGSRSVMAAPAEHLLRMLPSCPGGSGGRRDVRGKPICRRILTTFPFTQEIPKRSTSGAASASKMPAHSHGLR